MKNTTHHIHLDSCPSTQLFLKENCSQYLNISKNLLVSTDNQTNGLGRGSNKWDQHSNSLAFSFTFEPMNPITLTSLEVGVLIVNYFKEKHDVELKLKWPNDILDLSGHKCGGIICHNPGEKYIIVGVGINLGLNKNEQSSSPYKTTHSQVFPEKEFALDDLRKFPKDIYQNLLENRLNKEELPSLWDKNCIHLNSKIRIEDEGKEYSGTFKGIGESGEAILDMNGLEKSLFSGSLYLD